MTIIQPFHNQNGYTAFNNYILDYIMPALSPNGWKVLCFIIRKTEGWHKQSDDLSFSQIKGGTGIGSDPTVKKALAELERGDYIIITRHDGQWKSNSYSLNLSFSLTIETIVDDPPSTTETIVDSTIETIAGSTIESIDTKETINKQQNKENDGDCIFGKICTAWEQNIGLLSPILADNIKDYLGQCPGEWILLAIKTAAEAGGSKRSWRYIRAILDNWIALGHPDLPEFRPKEPEVSATVEQVRAKRAPPKSEGQRLFEQIITAARSVINPRLGDLLAQVSFHSRKNGHLRCNAPQHVDDWLQSGRLNRDIEQLQLVAQEFGVRIEFNATSFRMPDAALSGQR